ncbi:TPA: HK97 family phage prohead protease, partial [Neisseria meningitidis]
MTKLYAEIAKMETQDDGTVKVWGYASSEEIDSDGEVIAAAAMKAAIPDYMKFGAGREMHGSNAAGTAIEINVEDDGITFFGAHIIDPVVVSKVKTGVYKGFSIGGSVTARDDLNKSQITGLKLTEISLIDRPANPDAVFTCFKADKGAEAVNNDTEHNATYFSHFPSKQKTKKHRRQPMPLPLQVPLFFHCGQHWFSWAFWCGRTD